MFVTVGAVMKLKEKRKEEFYDSYVRSLIEEAKKLGISGDEIIAMVARGYER